jgi:hypothetical protein
MTAVTIVAGLFVLAALITAFPRPQARKRSALGYRAVCPFAPMSTLALLLVGGMVWLIGSLA